MPDSNAFIHPSSLVDEPASVGPGTKIWHFCHVMGGARIGRNCILGQNVHIASRVVVGDRVKIQNNVSLYDGVEVGDDVFLGPSCVFTNVLNPRAEINRREDFRRTQVLQGATIGANATILCGIVIGRYALVAAGAVVTRSVPDHALVIGNPGRAVGWASHRGLRLPPPSSDGTMRCPESGLRYQLGEAGRLVCLDTGA